MYSITYNFRPKLGIKRFDKIIDILFLHKTIRFSSFFDSIKYDPCYLKNFYVSMSKASNNKENNDNQKLKIKKQDGASKDD